MHDWHLNWVITGRKSPFVDESTARACVRDLVRLHAERLSLFCFVDDHLHAVLALLEAGRAAATAIGRSIRLSLRSRLGLDVQPAHVEEVEGRRHLESLVAYLFRQPRHHGLRTHNALWSGSSFLDTIGARSISGFVPRIWTSLPRLRLVDMLVAAEVEPHGLVRADLALVRRLGPYRLVEAASAATAAPPGLAGRTAAAVQAREAAARIGVAAGFTSAQIGVALGVTPWAALRLAQRRSPGVLTEVVLSRLGLEHHMAAAAQRAFGSVESSP